MNLPDWFSNVLVALVAFLVPLLIVYFARSLFRRVTSVELGSIKLEMDKRALELAKEVKEEVPTDVTEVPSSNVRPEIVTRADQKIDQQALDILRTTLYHTRERLTRLEKEGRVLNTKTYVLLETYHNQGLAQSRVSFWFSLVLATAGFVVIVVAAITGGSATNGGTPLTFVAGAITQAVSVLFFAQSNRSRRLMEDFFRTLGTDRRREEALSLAQSIENPTLRGALKAALAMQLIDSKISPTILPGFGSSSSDIDSVNDSVDDAAKKTVRPSRRPPSSK